MDEHWWGDVVEVSDVNGISRRLEQVCKYCGIPRIIDRIELDANGAPSVIPHINQIQAKCRKTYQAGGHLVWPLVRF